MGKVTFGGWIHNHVLHNTRGVVSWDTHQDLVVSSLIHPLQHVYIYIHTFQYNHICIYGYMQHGAMCIYIYIYIYMYELYMYRFMYGCVCTWNFLIYRHKAHSFAISGGQSCWTISAPALSPAAHNQFFEQRPWLRVTVAHVSISYILLLKYVVGCCFVAGCWTSLGRDYCKQKNKNKEYIHMLHV